MEGGSFIFLAMLAVTIGSRASALKVGEFANLQSATGCFKTIPNCASCLDHRTCLRCQKGFAFLESYWGALCVVKCPEGFTEVATSGNGTMCKSRKGCSKIVNCSQCEETFGDSCDVCEKGFLLFQQKTGSGVHCLTSCPAGFMEHGTRCRAEKCEDFFCSRCKEGLILQNKGGNNCLEKCPSGFFRKQDLLSGQAYCERCRRGCKKCRDPYDCFVCDDRFVLFKGAFSKCLRSCPTGYKTSERNSSRNSCIKDNNGCLDKSCYRCVADWHRVVIRRQYHCRKKCPVGHFGFLTAQKTKLCFRCPYSCQSCSSSRKCQQCKPGFFKLERGRGRLCVGRCPRNYVARENPKGQKICVKESDDVFGRFWKA